MALNELEDRLESAIRHINTALDIDPWAQNLAVESMRMRIAILKTGQSDIIRCKDCKHWREGTAFSYCDKLHGMGVLDALDYMTTEDDYCSMAERETDECIN